MRNDPAHDNRPIGCFDSGLGGLTVAGALMKLMPKENFVYFGDTGRVPYGTRSRTVIRQYARQDMDFLLSKDVKMVIAACGTVSSVAPDIGEALPVPYLGVVNPAAEAAVRATRNRRVGVIGTSATVGSGSFVEAIRRIDDSVAVFQQSCPLLVNLVEEGFTGEEDPVPRLVVQRYLAPLVAEGVDTLILGCTHFPLLASVIAGVMGEDVRLVSTGDAAAEAARNTLVAAGLTCAPEREKGRADFYVSDRTDSFSRLAGAFLGREISDDVNRIELG